MPPHTEPWDAYYARTLELPKTSAAVAFLDRIPPHGKILDFGAGSGRWCAAFKRDRPDLVIHALDQHIDKAALLAPDWNGEKIQQSFEEYTARERYDGIWSFASLFFLPKKTMAACFHQLSESLKPGGVITFTMVDDSHTTTACGFYGLSEAGILTMLEDERLELLIIKNFPAQYGKKKTAIPTFTVSAQKQ